MKFALAISAALLSALAFAQQSKRPISAMKTDTPPVIDGDVSDAVWQSAPKAEGFFDFLAGATPAPAEQTTAWVAYDAQYIYAAFYCHDSQPEGITARETVRDWKYQKNETFVTEKEDNVELVLDPFLARRPEDLTRFSVNAIGTKSVRIAGGRGNKSEWKGDWDAAVKKVGDGWTVEMRIPWQILNYPSSAKPTDMGINFFRFQFRTQTNGCWSNIGPNVYADQEGIWTGVQPPFTKYKPSLSLLPYIAPSISDHRSGARAGLDARYTITPELTAVGSLNPDFGTIEGAVESIQFQHGERLLDERRPFFLEGADNLNSQINSVGTFFYSRRIPDFDFGTKLYGKLTPADSIGILNVTDFGKRNDLVARYRHDLSGTVAIKTMMLNASGRDGSNSVAVLSPEGRWGKFSVSGDFAHSAGRGNSAWNKGAYVSYGDKFLFWAARFLDVGDEFENDLGFVPFTGIRGIRPVVLWGANYQKGTLRSLTFDASYDYTYHSNGDPFQQGGAYELDVNTRDDWDLYTSYTADTFDGLVDRYVYFQAVHNVSDRFHQWGVVGISGKQAGESYTFFGPNATVLIFKHLVLDYSGAFQNFEGHDQQHVVTASYDVSPTRSFGARIVANNADTNWYVSFRNSGQKGTETYVILGDPNAAKFKRRLTLKFVFAL